MCPDNAGRKFVRADPITFGFFAQLLPFGCGQSDAAVDGVLSGAILSTLFSSSSGARPAPGIFFSLILHSPLLPPGLRFDKRQAPPLASARLRAITVFPVGLVGCPANGADALSFAPLCIAQGIYRILMLEVVGYSLCAIDGFDRIRGTRRAVPLVWPGDSVWRATDGTAIRAAKLSHIPSPFAGFVRCRLLFPPLHAALGAIPCAWAAQK